jgi:hypothetical protein
MLRTVLEHSKLRYIASLLKTIRIHLVLFGMQNRTCGPYSAAINRILVPVMHAGTADDHFTCLMRQSPQSPTSRAPLRFSFPATHASLQATRSRSSTGRQGPPALSNSHCQQHPPCLQYLACHRARPAGPGLLTCRAPTAVPAGPA